MTTSPHDRRAVSRPRAVLAALLLLAGLAVMVQGVDALRHPEVVTPVPEAAFDPGDPRQAIECPSAPAASAPPVRVTSDDLYECPAVYDGLLVRYEGEVVGALMRRRTGAWTQLNDDAYAGDLGPLPAHRDFRGGNAGVGVHLPSEVADDVEWVGGPAARGDVLGIVGTFHRVDEASGEVAVIRATDAETVRAGEPIDHTPLPGRRVVALLVGLAAFGLLAVERVQRWRS